MNAKEVLKIAVSAGEILLVSGAEVFRVEDTIIRVSKSYGIDCECFVMPSGIFVSSIGNESEEISYVKRIKDRYTDLHRIELINTFSRRLETEPLPYDKAMEELAKIKSGPNFTFSLRLISAGIIAFVYTLIFKGMILDGLISATISMCIYTYREKRNTGGFQYLQLMISGIFAGAVTIGMSRIFPIINIDSTIIGSIMILVPGFAITNGIKDALYGDIMSSLSRIGEAIYVVVAVGIGVAITLLIGSKWM